MNSALITIFDGNLAPRTISLDEFEKDTVYFGRDPQNDIVLTSHLVSAEHGRFVYKNDMWMMEDKAVYMGQGSTNGLIYNNTSVTSHAVVDGDFIRIDDGVETITEAPCGGRFRHFFRGRHGTLAGNFFSPSYAGLLYLYHLFPHFYRGNVPAVR